MRIQPYLALLSLVGLAAARSGRMGRGRYRQQSVMLPSYDDDECPKGAYIVGVRGTLETEDFGAMNDTVNELLGKIPGSVAKAIDYPAAGIANTSDGYRIEPWVYSASKTAGGDALRAELRYFVERCPDTPVVLMGYSQGAHVVGDAVCGVWPGIWPVRPSVPGYVKDSIKAIVQFGDPANRKDVAWHKGTSTNGGIVPRQSFALCKDLASTWQSYCDADDVFCDRGESVKVHFAYAIKYRKDVVDHIIGKVKSSVHCLTDDEL